MNNDLISREALKKALKEYKYCGFYDKVIEIIDNAPTVDIKDEIAGAYNEGYMCGSREAEKARPQGEWIEVDIKSTPYGGYTCNRKCNKCGYFTREYRLNFCPNCGAKMKGGAV